ncbi:hypothetical protein ACGFNP_60620 [Nonomuraea sp. NPDC049269]|uniref:hypothetical protein n=1 Tax=Nonomuraea sp. NPDC049269 TaxID=3364349 RepID=UPI00372289AD
MRTIREDVDRFEHRAGSARLAPGISPKGTMSDTPSTEDCKRSASFPESIGEFLVVLVILLLMWATGSWLAKKYDWADHGYFQAPLGHLMGTFAGGAMRTFAVFSLPMLLWRLGRSIPRRAYIRLSAGLLLCGPASLIFLLWMSDGGGPVQTWPQWLLVGVVVGLTFCGLAGLGHCAFLARRARGSAG